MQRGACDAQWVTHQVTLVKQLEEVAPDGFEAPQCKQNEHRQRNPTKEV